LTRRIALLEHLPESQVTGLGSSSGQEAAVAASGSVAGAGSGALQRTGALQRPGTLQGQDQERCSAQERCSVRERVPGKICDVEQVPGSFPGKDL